LTKKGKSQEDKAPLPTGRQAFGRLGGKKTKVKSLRFDKF